MSASRCCTPSIRLWWRVQSALQQSVIAAASEPETQLNKLINKAVSVLGTALEPMDLITKWREQHKLWNINGKSYATSSHGGNSSRREIKTSLSPATLKLLLEDPEVFQGQKGYVIPLVSSGSTPGFIPSWKCLKKNLQGEATRRHPKQMPKQPQLSPFNAEEPGFHF